ncbi:MAG: site-2 protease family protein [Bacillota bacterium]
MRLFSVGATQIRCSILFLIAVPVGIMAGAMGPMLTALFSLSLHEMSHAMAARGLGYEIAAIELEPFGFVARLRGPLQSNASEIAVAAAGPTLSLVVATAAAALIGWFPRMKEALEPFVNFNLLLAAINLLPALPLDGGRICRVLLSNVLRARTATLLCAWAGILCGAGMIVLGAILIAGGNFNLTAPIMGVFLLLAAARELKFAQSAQLHAMVRRARTLRRGETLGLRHVAIHASTRAGEALASLSLGKYNLLLVVDDSLLAIGQMDEGTLLNGIARYGKEIPVGEMLLRMRKPA